MKIITAAIAAVAVLTAASAASAGPMHHHGHKVCTTRHHRHFCSWR